MCMRADSVGPVASIGIYQADDGSVVGAAPAPCFGGSTVRFEISANEFPRRLQCRFASWDDRIGAFGNAPERWSAETVWRWLGDPKHVTAQQVQLNLTQFRPAFAGLTGAALVDLNDAALAQAPFSVASLSHRTSILNAIDEQKTPFESCRTNRSVPAQFKEISTVELGHGLKLFQLRGIDAAGNVGEPAEYIWFNGACFHLPRSCACTCSC